MLADNATRTCYALNLRCVDILQNSASLYVISILRFHYSVSIVDFLEVATKFYNNEN